MIEGEVIAIDLSTGSYYSMRGTASEIWSLLGSGVAPDAIVQRLQGRGADEGTVATEVPAFIERLQEEHLIVPDEGPAADAPAAEEAPPYETPELERFDDMQDLILLDPVHEVDATEGWPHRPPSSD